MKGTRPISFTFGYLLLFPPLSKGGERTVHRDRNTKKEAFPDDEGYAKGNENPAVVLAREFSISDSANPFYLKLRNSIPPAIPSPAHLRGTKEFTLATFLPRWVFPALDLSSSAVFVSHCRGKDERVDGYFYIF